MRAVLHQIQWKMLIAGAVGGAVTGVAIGYSSGLAPQAALIGLHLGLLFGLTQSHDAGIRASQSQGQSARLS